MLTDVEREQLRLDEAIPRPELDTLKGGDGMFGPSRIGGYIRPADDVAFCVLCWSCPTDEEEIKAAQSLAYLQEEFPGGLDCSKCGAAIVEAYMDPPGGEA